MRQVDLQARIDSARQRVSEPDTAELDVALGSELQSLRFTKMQARDWLNLTAEHPARPRSSTDAAVGFNIDAVAAGYPPRLIEAFEGDESETLDKEKWAALLAGLEAPDLRLIGTTVWGLNYFTASAQAEALRKKASGLSGQ